MDSTIQKMLNSLYGEIVETRNELVCKFLKDSTLLLVNNAYAKTFNRTIEDLIGVKFLDLVPEEEHEAIKQHLDNLTQKKPEIIYNHPVVTTSDEEVWLEWYDRAVFNEEGQLEYFISIGRDITEQKMMQLKLENQQLLQALLMDVAIDLVNIPVHGLDDAINNALREIGNFANVDRAYVFLYDFENKFIDNTHEWCNDGIKPEINNLQGLPLELFPEWEEHHKKGDVLYIPDVEALPADSNTREVLLEQNVKTLITAPMMNGDTCLGFVGFDAVREIREWDNMERRLLNVLAEIISNSEIRRRFESEIISARYEAEASNEAKSQFLANISHEIRTPLNGIIGMIDLLKKTNLDDEQQNFLKIINTSGETLQSIIEDLLDLHRIEINEVEINEEDFNLFGLIDEVTELFSSKAIAKNLSIEVNREHIKNIFYKGARLRIKQVLMNLVSNAVKFTDDGSVKIKVSLTQKDIESGLEYIRFEVSDTGIGISKNNLEKLFKPFSQIDESSTRKYGGSGLGLIISKSLVERMQGVIGLESEEDIGTTVWFNIPLKPGKQRAESDLAKSTVSVRSVLVVAGHSMSTIFLKQQLKSHQYDYELAEDFEEARRLSDIKKLKSEAYMAVMIYVNHEIDEVLKFVDFLKDEPGNFNLRVVLIVEKGYKINRSLMDEHDISDILTRPIRTFEIEKVLQNTNENELQEIKPAEPKPADSRQYANNESITLYTGKVLVAEDNYVNKMLIELMLRKTGVDFTVAENGKEAVEEVEKGNYDIVFMDCQMPVLDGFQATAQIRALNDSTKANIHIVAVTAHVIKGYRERCLTAGMNDYISKPYKMKDILNVFEEHLTPKISQATEEKASRAQINVRRIKERFGSSNEFIKSLLSHFIDDTASLLDELEHVCTKKMLKEAYEINHNLKGAAINVEADSIYQLTLNMEKAINSRDYKSAELTLVKFRKALESLSLWYDAHLDAELLAAEK